MAPIFFVLGTVVAWGAPTSVPGPAAEAALPATAAVAKKSSLTTEKQGPAPGATAAGATVAGASIYNARCAACHRANGAGSQGGIFPALAGNTTVTAPDPKDLLATIAYGRNMMPSWKGQLPPGEIAAVATYIRSAWGNKAGPVNEIDVASIK
jgi:cytochrome c oxidase subunit 2